MKELTENRELGYNEIFNIFKRVAEKTRESNSPEEIWSAAMLDPEYARFSSFDKAYIAIYKEETKEFRRFLYIGSFSEEQKEAYNEYAGDWRSIYQGKLFKHLLNLWEETRTQSYVVPDFKNDLHTNPEITTKIGIESGISTVLVAANKVIGFAIVGYKLASQNLEQRRAKLKQILSTHELLVNLAGLQIGLFGRYQEIQNELTEAQRLNTAAQFALGVVHDIKSVILPINVYLPELKRCSAEDSKGMRAYSAIEHSIVLIKSIAEELLDFAEAGQHSSTYSLNYSVVPISTLISEAKLLAAVPLSIKFDTSSVPVDLKINVDKEKMVRVILNLIKNATEAIRRKTPQQREKNSAKIIKMSATSTSMETIISIQDTGRGIEPEKLELIFNPFYSDKKTSVGSYIETKGYGLGLAVAKMVVEAHGGHIAVESTPGAGTRFDIFLPKHSQ